MVSTQTTWAVEVETTAGVVYTRFLSREDSWAFVEAVEASPDLKAVTVWKDGVRDFGKY